MRFRAGFESSGLALLLVAVPATVAGNIPVPSYIGVGAPFWLSVETLGLLFLAIVCIEAAVFRLAGRVSWKVALATSLLANLVSSMVGIFIGAGSCFLLLLVVVTGLLVVSLRETFRSSALASWLVGLAPIAAILFWGILTFPGGRALEQWAALGALVPGFILSVVIEGVVIARTGKCVVPWRSLLVANTASYALLLCYVLAANPYSGERNPLLSIDYLLLSASSLAGEGQVEKAVELLEISWDLDDASHPHHITEQLKIGLLLARNGGRAEAERLLKLVSDEARGDSTWGNNVRAVEKELRRELGLVPEPGSE